MIYQGSSFNALLNYNNTANSSAPAVTVTLNYNTLNNIVRENTPVVSPYGYIGIPDDNTGCAYAGTGGFYSRAVIGYLNNLNSNSNISDIIKGEIAIVSKGNYAFKIKNDKLFITFTNGSEAVIDTRVTIDENVNTILIDTIAEIASLESKVNSMIEYINRLVNTIPTLQVGTGAVLSVDDSTPITTYTPTANYTRDQTFLGSDGLNNFVDENGELIS
jgi:hypothetical protein